jgi:hypothetical protein
MKCRKFKSNHVGFIDDCLSAADMADMRRHLMACNDCAAFDTRIRRSLLVVRNLPQIEPSPDFFSRLTEALEHAPAPQPRQPAYTAATAIAAATAALAAAVYFVMAISGDTPAPSRESQPSASMAASTPVVLPMNDMAIAAAVPAGIPVWPAMFMVGELPAHVANAELLDNTLGR